MIINMNGAKAPETPSPVLQEKTVTPATLPTVIGADEGYTGLSQVTVNPDTNLKAENIRSGKTIFGVDGSFVGEPVYTDGLDASKLSGNIFNSDYSTIFTLTAPVWNSNPTRLTELDFTINDSPSHTDASAIRYGRGAIVDGVDTPKLGSSSYLSDVSSVYYYKEYGSYEGEVTFYLPYKWALYRLGWYNETIAPSHIKGKLFVYLAVHFGESSSFIIDRESEVNRVNGYGSGIYELQVDSDLTWDSYGQISDMKALTFTATVPKIEGYVTGYSYRAKKATGAVLVGSPRQMVIT